MFLDFVLTIFFLGALTFLFVFTMIVYDRENDQERRLASFRRMVQVKGYEYRATGRLPKDVHQILPEIYWGDLAHLIDGERQGLQFLIFETQPPKATTLSITNTMVFALDLTESGIDLPSFMLRPRQAADNVKQKLGFQTISLPESQSNRFTFISFEDKGAWEAQFRQIPAAFYKQLHPKTYLISNGRWLLYFKASRTIAPTEATLRSFIQQGVDQYHTLQQALNGA